MLLSYEQMYIQNLRYNGELIPEQQPNEHNPMYEFFRHVSIT
jgi:hypothetical protein